MTGLRRTPPRSGEDSEGKKVATETGGAIPKTREKKYASICKEPKLGMTYEIAEVEDEEENCGICKKKVRSDQNGISCDSCEMWYHCGCVKMSVDEYKCIQKLGKRLTWNCGRCGISLKEQNDRLKEENKKLIELLRNLEMKIDHKIEGIKHEVKNSIAKQVKDEIIEEIKEEEEKKKRQKNLVVYKIEESTNENKEERELEDKEKCLNLMNRCLEIKVENNDIEKLVRLGRRNENNRPLLVIMREKDKKYEILSNASKLRNAQEEEHRKVYISPDLTIKQREENKKLREELKRRRENGENLYIKGGKLVEVRSNFRN